MATNKELSWPSAGSFVSAYEENLMAADRAIGTAHRARQTDDDWARVDAMLADLVRRL